jgi:hypothetical protein
LPARWRSAAAWLYAYTEAGLEGALRLYGACGMVPVAEVEGWGCADQEALFGDVDTCVELLAWLGPGGGLQRQGAAGGAGGAVPLLRRRG